MWVHYETGNKWEAKIGSEEQNEPEKFTIW